MRHLLTLVLLSSCVDSSRPAWLDVDASPTAEIDADIIQYDAGRESSVGAVDIGVDAGQICECSSGPCCDGCFFRPTSFQCSTLADGPYTSANCGTFQADICGGADWSRIELTRVNRWCTGDASECTGRTEGAGAVDSMLCDPDLTKPYGARCVFDPAGLGARCEACP